LCEAASATPACPRSPIRPAYRDDGLVMAAVEAANATDACVSVLADGLVGHLDHAAYLGGEPARAGHALRGGGRYQRDAAPG